jgi:hypothetical protein
MLSAWERTAASFAQAVVRDPRTLEAGARLLKSQLLFRRAFALAWDALWAPDAGGAGATATAVAPIRSEED